MYFGRIMVLGPECLPSILLLAVPFWPCSTPFYEFNFKWPADLSLPRPSSLPLEPTSPSRGITIRSYDPTAIIRQTRTDTYQLGEVAGAYIFDTFRRPVTLFKQLTVWSATTSIIPRAHLIATQCPLPTYTSRTYLHQP